MLFACSKKRCRLIPEATMKHLPHVIILLLLPTALCAQETGAPNWRFDLEAGAVWADHNDVQIPNDDGGDRFDIADFGKGPYPSARASLQWRPWQRHAFQFVIAPLFYEESGEFAQDTRFAGANYRAATSTDIDYQFNSYRLRYLYSLVRGNRWNLELGGTLFIRDAKIELRQGDIRSSDDNIGFVPLFALRTQYDFSEQWSVELDTDLAWAPQGRAIDLALLIKRDLPGGWDLAAGYRTIEGGADNSNVYTFAWFNAAVLRAGYQW